MFSLSSPVFLRGMVRPVTRQNIVHSPKRRIYFSRPEREVAVVDFALNLGYNDLYGAYCGQYLNWQGKMKLTLRQQQLTQMFRTHYYLLLKAITTQNYEQLESLTEEKLTLALAAQIYELSVLKGLSFDTESDLMSILDQSSTNSAS